MKIINYSYPMKTELKSIAVALGFFDGVHVGHRKLISLLVRKAREKGLSPYIFTFADTLSKTKNTQSIIYNLDEKNRIFESLGVDGVIVADFSSISNLSPEVFVRNALLEDLDVSVALCGYNFRFGKNASANSEDLVRLMRVNGRDAIVVDECRIDGKALSTTVIRQLIKEKNLDEANKMLGVPYFIEGVVERGLGLGKSYGFPTINLPVRENSPLPIGVYRCAVQVDGAIYTAITNVGRCPTVKEREIHAEAMIADFDGDLYGKTVRIFFLAYLREEQTFSSIEKLREQIYLDKERSIKENGDLKWLEIGPSLQ